MRKFLAVLVVLLVAAVAADRVAAYVADRLLAAQLRTSAGLSSDPAVTVRGVPFLTQVLAGRYDRIDVRARDVERGGARLSDLHVELRGLRLPLSRALSGAVRDVPVDGLAAQVTLTYADVVRGRTELVVRPAGRDLLRVTGSLRVLGITVDAVTRSTVTLQGNDLVVTAQSLSVAGLSNPLVDRALAGRLDLRVPVGSLPFGLRLTGLRVTAAGLVLDARSGPTVLRAP